MKGFWKLVLLSSRIWSGWESPSFMELLVVFCWGKVEGSKGVWKHPSGGRLVFVINSWELLLEEVGKSLNWALGEGERKDVMFRELLFTFGEEGCFGLLNFKLAETFSNLFCKDSFSFVIFFLSLFKIFTSLLVLFRLSERFSFFLFQAKYLFFTNLDSFISCFEFCFKFIFFKCEIFYIGFQNTNFSFTLVQIFITYFLGFLKFMFLSEKVSSINFRFFQFFT